MWISNSYWQVCHGVPKANFSCISGAMNKLQWIGMMYHTRYNFWNHYASSVYPYEVKDDRKSKKWCYVAMSAYHKSIFTILVGHRVLSSIMSELILEMERGHKTMHFSNYIAHMCFHTNKNIWAWSFYPLWRSIQKSKIWMSIVDLEKASCINFWFIMNHDRN